MEYFCILESQNRGKQELFEKIYDVRALCDTDNFDLLLDVFINIIQYDILAIKYMVRNKTFLEHAHEFYEEAL